jgi:hypothetical protein
VDDTAGARQRLPVATMRIVLSVLGLCSLANFASAASFLDWILPRHDVQVITVTDTTPVGALRRLPSADQPVYYLAINAGYREFGGIIAGEKIPKPDEVLKTIAKVLAKQHILPGSDANPPSLLLLWTWGTMNTERFYNPSSDDMEGRQINRRQLLRFLGAYKVGLISKERSSFQDELMMPGMMLRDADSEMLADLSTEDLYVAAISAYDFKAAAERQEKVLLWTTKISCPSRGLSLPETLPVMLSLAGPYIGRETARPVSVKATDKYKAEVQIGDPKVVEYIENNPLPIIQPDPTTAKKTESATKKKAPVKKKR